MIGLIECRRKVRHSYNDNTGIEKSTTKGVDIGDNPARKMEAKSIMISILLPVDLSVCDRLR
ncbi:hypothetical protein FWP46_15185 [Vibrio alginolyticus]|nr:hypothetical protein [Vibrio alginolyticus]